MSCGGGGGGAEEPDFIKALRRLTQVDDTDTKYVKGMLPGYTGRSTTFSVFFRPRGEAQGDSRRQLRL